jgi:hypothetical protein
VRAAAGRGGIAARWCRDGGEPAGQRVRVRQAGDCVLRGVCVCVEGGRQRDGRRTTPAGLFLKIVIFSTSPSFSIAASTCFKIWLENISVGGLRFFTVLCDECLNRSIVTRAHAPRHTSS